MLPPFVSHSTTSVAPASAAARIVFAAYSRIALPAVEEMLRVVDHFPAG